ncbi:winged helix-turn-helix domain-containing protein [Haladaptatus pallidirubidus]|uniref:helix-turn-helix domain-containing protein n=1 Tax=Haladaptatus pallidirubidus TaxID=1008152 RepID=UPI0035EC754D
MVNVAPSEGGYDAPVWTPTLIRTYLEETFDITYSREHCRKLLHSAGLSDLQPGRVTTRSVQPSNDDSVQSSKSGRY